MSVDAIRIRTNGGGGRVRDLAVGHPRAVDATNGQCLVRSGRQPLRDSRRFGGPVVGVIDRTSEGVITDILKLIRP